MGLRVLRHRDEGLGDIGVRSAELVESEILGRESLRLQALFRLMQEEIVIELFGGCELSAVDALHEGDRAVLFAASERDGLKRTIAPPIVLSRVPDMSGPAGIDFHEIPPLK